MDDMAEIIRGGRSCRLINTKFAIQCWCRQIIASSSKLADGIGMRPTAGLVAARPAISRVRRFVSTSLIRS
jgi:hypothetical protein